MYQSQTQKSVKIKSVHIVLHFLFYHFFLFFFQPHFLVLLFSFFFLFLSNFFFQQSLVQHVLFFSVFKLFSFFAIRSIAHYLSFTLFNSLRVTFFLIFFLFCLKISWVFFAKPPKARYIKRNLSAIILQQQNQPIKPLESCCQDYNVYPRFFRVCKSK